MKEKQSKIRIKDIAKLANVSVGTIDRVIHNRGEVKAETRNKVMAIIKEMGYTPNLLAKSLALKKNIRIAILIPEPVNIDNPYWEQPLIGINQAIQELCDYNVDIQIYKFNTIDEKSFARQSAIILKNNHDGVVFAPAFYKRSLTFIKKCNVEEIPIVFIDSNIDGVDTISYFGQNAEQSGYLAAKLMSYSLLENSKVLILNLANKKAITKHLKRREKGFINYIDQFDGSHTISTLSVEIDPTDKHEPEKSLRKIFAKNPEIKGLFVTNARVHQVAKFVYENDYSDLLLVGYDLINQNIKYVKEGIIDFLICQKPVEQGYKSVMALFNYILTKKPIKRINYSQIDIIVKENIEYY